MDRYKRAKALVDLDAVVHNIKAIRDNVPKGVKLTGVVKADAYGHGDVPVALALQEYVDFIAVATTAEALNLYYHNIYKPILILGPVPEFDYGDIVKHEVRATIFTMEQARAISKEAVAQNRKAYVHIAVDTGMNRIGCRYDEEAAKEVKEISKLEGIEIEGVFSHMYKADAPDRDCALKQFERLEKFIELLKKEGIEPKIRHISNSAGSVRNIGSSLDMVRAGIVLYGIKPDNDMDMEGVELKQVMTIKSMITHIKEVDKGETIGYGATYTLPEKKKIATISFGYGDGYPRTLSNKGYILVHGKKAPITGRVCMDQFMVDVSDIPDAKIGDEVTILGKDGDEVITAELLGDLSMRFSYELSCDWSKRIPRIYLRDGKVVGVKDYTINLYQDFLK